MPKYTFLALCYEYTVDPFIALKNDKVKDCIMRNDAVGLAVVLQNEF